MLVCDHFAFARTGAPRTAGDDGHLFSREHSSRFEFSNHGPGQTRLIPPTLPHNFRRHLQPLPVAIGRLTFLRRRPSGRITVLGVKFKIGKRLAHQYISATLYTRTMILKTYSQGRLLKQFDFPFVGKRRL